MSGDTFQERVRIASARGQLAGELAYPCGEPTAACLVVNPHPYMGGHMNNNVVTALAGGLAGAGLATLRFDYAGVGESAGPAIDVVAGMSEFWATGKSLYDAAMYEDAACAAGWLRANVPLPVVLVGYSFGANAMQAALADDVVAAAMISPTLVQHDLSRLALLTIPKLVIYSDNDFATPRKHTESWCATAAGPVSMHCISGANHFFKGCEEELTSTCRGFLGQHLAVVEDQPCPS